MHNKFNEVGFSVLYKANTCSFIIKDIGTGISSISEKPRGIANI